MEFEKSLEATLNIIEDGAAAIGATDIGSLPQGCCRDSFALCEQEMVNLLAPRLVGDANSLEKPLRPFCRGRRGRDFSGGDVAALRAGRQKFSCSARNQIVHCTKILRTPV